MGSSLGDKLCLIHYINKYIYKQINDLFFMRHPETFLGKCKAYDKAEQDYKADHDVLVLDIYIYI